MKVERGWWKGRGWGTVLVLSSLLLIALNLLGGRSPLKMGVLSAFRPLFSFLGEIDPPAYAGEESASSELAVLRAKNARLAYEVFRLRDLLSTASGAEFERKRYPFLALPAQVICRAGVPGLRSVVVVDRGAGDGVRKGMGVVAGDRVVGRVYRVGEKLSFVLLLSDPACKVRATFLTGLPGASGGEEAALPLFEGLCEGNLEGEGMLRFRHLPLHAGLETGYAVVTTGYAGVFPAGMSVGTVTTVSEQAEGMFLEVTAAPAVSEGLLYSVSILLPDLHRELQTPVRGVGGSR